MDLRSAHKGKEKLCFSLARRFGGGDSSLPGAKTGQAEFSEKTGGTVLPFSLRKQRKNQKYLRLSRKKFPRMASLENRNCRHEFFLNDAVDLEAQQSPEDWEAVQHTSKEGKARHPLTEKLWGMRRMLYVLPPYLPHPGIAAEVRSSEHLLLTHVVAFISADFFPGWMTSF